MANITLNSGDLLQPVVRENMISFDLHSPLHTYQEVRIHMANYYSSDNIHTFHEAWSIHGPGFLPKNGSILKHIHLFMQKGSLEFWPLPSSSSEV